MRRIIGLGVVAVLVFLGVTTGAFAMMMCGSGHSDEHSSGHKASAQPASEDIVEVANTVCPVSGEKIKKNTTAKVEYDGKIYNLCCPMCEEEFNKEPQKYIEKLETMEEKEMQHHEEDEGHHHE